MGALPRRTQNEEKGDTKLKTKIKQSYYRLASKLIYLQVFLLSLIHNPLNTYALAIFGGKGESVENSKAATGTEELINDVTSWLMVLIPLIGTVLIIYFALRRSGADEHSRQEWDKRIKVAITSIVIGLLSSSIINILTHYYG